MGPWVVEISQAVVATGLDGLVALNGDSESFAASELTSEVVFVARHADTVGLRDGELKDLGVNLSRKVEEGGSDRGRHFGLGEEFAAALGSRYWDCLVLEVVQ